jgi:hypothetical protein
MGKKAPELPPEQAEAVAWLRTRAGEAWSRKRIGFSGRIAAHHDDSGVFASVTRDGSRAARVRWPAPHGAWDLGPEEPLTVLDEVPW